MPPMFDPQHWDTLTTQCRLVSGEQRDRDYALPMAALLEPATCTELLDRLGPVIGSPSRHVTASLLGKRIAFLTTASCLYAMSGLDRGLDLSLANCFIEYRHEDGLWQSRLPLADLTPSAPAAGQRDSWRQDILHRLFADNLSRLWQTFHTVARVPLPVLWENTAVRVYSVYERRLVDIDCANRRQQIADDFHYLVHQTPPELFANSYNPLQRFFRPRSCQEPCGSSTRIRKTCCYYFQATTPEEYCSTCPLPQVRHNKRSAIR